MTVLVDTSIWSLVLRRRSNDLNRLQGKLVAEWRELVREGRIAIIGPVRQELLSGVRRERQFDSLRNRLAAFPDTLLVENDFVAAARFFNLCRDRGIATDPIDLLICSTSHRLSAAIFSTHRDFARYADHLPIQLHETRSPIQ